MREHASTWPWRSCVSKNRISVDTGTNRSGRFYCAPMDILIMVLLLSIALLIWRGAKRGLVIGLWVIGAVAVLGLFKYHVTSVLDLSF